MSRFYLSALLIPILLMSVAIFSGCSKQPEVIMAVPLCDCTHNTEDPRSDCWEGYICDSSEACSHDGGLIDKCVPEGSYNPHRHGTSY